jgi:hypothetical protein
MRGRGLDLCVLEYGLVPDSCEDDNKPSGPKNHGIFK